MIDIISSEKGYVSILKDESDGSSQTKVKNYHLKNGYCIILILCLFIHLLPINKILSNVDSSFNKQLNKMSKLYKFIFSNLIVFFSELNFYKIFFLILMQILMDKREYLLYIHKKWMVRNYSTGSKNDLFEQKNLKTIICKLSDYKKIYIDNISIYKRQRNKGKKFLIRNMNNLRNFIKNIKYIILLILFNNTFVNNKVSLIEYNSYNITLNIRGIGNKNIFSSNYEFKSEYYPDEVYINGYKQNDVTPIYDLNQTDNFIELIWHNLINSSDHMFYECSAITEIDLSNFDTSNITNMQGMFGQCSSLTSINLLNFDTSNVEKMNFMFSHCSSLTSLDLLDFDTSKVTWMNEMFSCCSSLTSLDLSKFNTSNVERMYNMFEQCTNLEYINMINFNEIKLNNYSDMFINVPDNIVVCINRSNIPKIYPQINNTKCHIEDCTDNWKLKQNKFIEERDEYINNCSDINKYEYNGKCISSCQKGKYIDENGIVKCKCELEKCFTCPTVAKNKQLCTKCNDNYYQMENEPLNLGEYFNCYNETPNGYYLDIIEYIFKKIKNICIDSIDIVKSNIFSENNCFKTIEYNETRIRFDIIGININITGSCLYFNKSIYYGKFNCIEKPENSYYVLNGIENTGVIKDCNESCKSCYGESTEGNTNCIECAEGYFKTEDSNTNCMNVELIPSNYYLNETDNIYYKCHQNCQTCNGTYDNIANDMHCILCVNNTFLLYGDNKSNCYYKEQFLESGKYYLSSNDNKFHMCYYSCSICVNNEPNETNHYCINCNIGYYFLENTTNCYNEKTIIKNYYLNKSGESFIWRQCTENCKSCNLFEITNGDCVLTCPNGTYKNILNNSCVETCPNNYIVYNDICIQKINEQEIILSDFKNKILSNINLYMNSTKFINGTNFIGIALSSNYMDSKIQLRNGISPVDLGYCTEIIKENYNISKNESLMIFNIETKNININNNNDNCFNLGKNTHLEIYDISGRELDLSICKEDIKVMKYIGDVKELNIQSAISLSEQGIDVFNARDAFFNDICHPYDDQDGKDIIINDRRTDIYQNVTFCQYGCSYFGMNYDLMVANCKCNSSLLQEKGKNITEKDELKSEKNIFKEFAKSFKSNLIDFNFEILKCYNLILNIKILIHNVGFFSLFGMLFLQIIFFIIYLIRKIEQIKNYILNFKDMHKTNKSTKNYNNLNLSTPIKKLKLKKDLLQMRNKKQNKKFNKIQNQKYTEKNIEEIDLNVQSNSDRIKMNEKENNLKNLLQNNNVIENNYGIMININNYSHEKEDNYNINNESNLITSKRKDKELELKAYNMETIPEKIDNVTNKFNSKINKIEISIILNKDEDLQDMDYEKAIIYDKRNYIKIFWSFLFDNQIILETFCTENYLYLFVIKLSFFVFTFQISFFLNALFYTNDYVSDAYHNNGVLDFIVGLPKSIYSFIVTLIITNLLKMLSNSKNELTEVINNRKRYDNYIDIIDKKLSKLRKKLIAYFILLFLLNIFFSYYVTVFCAVYRNSQKYWFYGCLESFAMDTLISLIGCILVSFLRFISIRKRIKCCFVLSNIINTLL